jgi:mRNA interferase MazF
MSAFRYDRNGRAKEKLRFQMSLPSSQSPTAKVYISIRNQEVNNMPFEVRRGEIYFADLSDAALGSEQRGYRPVLCIQNDCGNRYSPTTVVAAITSKLGKKMPTHYTLPGLRDLDIPSVVMCEQIRTVDKSRLRTYIGTLDEITMKGIDRAIAVSMGLRHEEEQV